MENNKISSRPPQKELVNDFILGAERKKEKTSYINTKNEPIYPWQNSKIRDDVQKVFTVRLIEEYILKIKYISEQTNVSQQKIVRDAICKEIDEIINRMK